MNFGLFKTTVCLGLLVAVESQVVFNTDECKELSNDVIRCSERYQLSEPEAHAAIVALIFSFNFQPEQYCGEEEKENFTNAATCIIGAYKNCSDNEFDTLLAEGQQYEQAIDLTCKAEKELEKCLPEYRRCVEDIFSNKTNFEKETFSEKKSSHCQNFERIRDCFSNCTKEAQDTISKVLDEITPEACGSSSVIVFSTALTVISLLGSLFV